MTHVGGRVVEEVVQADCKEIDNDAQDVTPPPLQSGVLIEGSCNWGSKDCEWDRGR